MRRGLLLLASVLLVACGDREKDHAAPATPPEPEGGGTLSLIVLEDPGLTLIGPDYDGIGYLGGARFWLDPSPPCRRGPVDYGCYPPADCSFPSTDEAESARAGSVTLGTLSYPAPDYQVVGPGMPYEEGESLQLVVGGDDSGVPAFQATLQSPSLVTLIDPAPGALEVAGSNDLEVVWSGNGYGDVLLALGSIDGPRFYCRWPSADGAGVVPGELLDTLEPSSDGTSNTANLQGFADTEVATGGFTFLATIQASRNDSGFLIDVR